MRTWKSLLVQASPWCKDPCSCGLDLKELQKIFCPWTKGGTSVKWFFHCGPPFDSKVEIFLSSWRSRPLEHGSTHHGEAWTIKLSHFLSFDQIDFAKIGLCLSLRVSHSSSTASSTSDSLMIQFEVVKDIRSAIVLLIASIKIRLGTHWGALFTSRIFVVFF